MRVCDDEDGAIGDIGETGKITELVHPAEWFK